MAQSINKSLAPDYPLQETPDSPSPLQQIEPSLRRISTNEDVDGD